MFIGTLAICAFLGAAEAGPAGACFVIKVVDSETGRGIPLVELRTVNALRFVTDSAGVVAFREVGLMGQDVFFEVKSHGYEEPPPDGFGCRGVTLKVQPGSSAVIKLKRINIAERLYRVTGEGIYHDSLVAGLPVPLKSPVLNGKVLGQDTVFMTEYRGRFFWLWGDTNKPSHPLGNFWTTCATSLKPGSGGLAPSVGVELMYFTDESGFAKPMCRIPGARIVWMAGLVVVPDDTGKPRLIAKYAVMEGLAEAKEQGLAIFNDEKELFEPFLQFGRDTRIIPDGQAYRPPSGPEREYVYFCAPPTIRVKAHLSAFKEPSRYEAFTCLEPGSRFEGASTRLERDAAGRLVWAWKVNTSPLSETQWDELVKAGKVKPEEAWNRLIDANSGRRIRHHWSTLAWNAYRKRWIKLINEEYGETSYLGEIWYSEADRPEGPWTKAVKVVTHNRYTFYNVCHHPEFDESGGRFIYFEGSYCNTFSGNEDRTPRYDYNQIMYRLDLADPRLAVLRAR